MLKEYETKSHDESFLPSFFSKKLVGCGIKSHNKSFFVQSFFQKGWQGLGQRLKIKAHT